MQTCAVLYLEKGFKLIIDPSFDSICNNKSKKII